MSAEIKSKNSKKEVEVLYQKLGNTWYAFSVIGSDVFYSPIEDEQFIAGDSSPFEPPLDEQSK